MKNKVKIESTYDLYKDMAERPVSKRNYKRIVSLYFKFMCDEVLKGNIVQFSSARTLGVLLGRGIKPKVSFTETGEVRGRAIDWNRTNKIWKKDPSLKEKKVKVYFTNEHTNGLKYNLCWWKNGMTTPNKDLFSLNFSKTTKRRFSKEILDGTEFLIVKK